LLSSSSSSCATVKREIPRANLVPSTSTKSCKGEMTWKLSTLLTRTPTNLLSYLSTLSTPCIYTLSSNLPSTLWSHYHPSSSQSIGCISHPLTSDPEVYSLAVAEYRGKGKVTTFGNRLRGPRPISLGREHRPDLHSDGKETGDGGFEAFLAGKEWSFGARTPTATSRSREGEGLQELQGFTPFVSPAYPLSWRGRLTNVRNRNEMVFFTADRTSALMSSLSTYPSSTSIVSLPSLPSLPL